MLEATVALGRLHWSGHRNGSERSEQTLEHLTPTLAHAAVQTLGRSRNWPVALEWLDAPDMKWSIVSCMRMGAATPGRMIGIKPKWSGCSKRDNFPTDAKGMRARCI